MTRLCPDCFEIMREDQVFCDSCWIGSSGGVAVVTGSRDYTGVNVIEVALMTHLPKIVIAGGASGADQIAESLVGQWQKQEQPIIEPPTFEKFDANWEKYFRNAGPIRNSEMLGRAEELRDRFGYRPIVLAFHPQLVKSKGTRNCVKQALERGIEVRLYAKHDYPPGSNGLGVEITVDIFNKGHLRGGDRPILPKS